MKRHPTKPRLKQLFDYRAGELFWRVTWGKARKGKKAGCPDGHGYFRVGVDGVDFQLHRLIWIWHYGATTKFIDHKNEKKTDNRIENLRVAIKAQNEWHTPKRKNNSTGFKGVYRLKQNTPSPFWAYLTVNGKRHGLGMHRTAKAASQAHLKAAKRLHGEFFCDN